VIVKEDDDTRGRPRGEAAEWICRGLEAASQRCPHEIILDETKAINSALDRATPGSLVVILPESVTRAIQLIEARNPVGHTTATQTATQNGASTPTNEQPANPAPVEVSQSNSGPTQTESQSAYTF